MTILGFHRWLSLLFVALVLLAPAPAIAGFLFIDDRGAQMLLSNGRLKHVSPSGEEPIVAVDAGRARMWVSNPRTRAYWEGTIDEFCTSVRGLLAGVTGGGGGGMPALSPEMEKMMKERMAGLPPEQQEIIKQMMQAAMARQGQPGAAGAAATPRVTVEPTGETETIAGFSTRKFRVLADGKLHEEVWLTNDPAITREFDPKRAPETIAKLSACRGAQQSRVQDTDPYRQLFTQGWPLKSLAHGGGFSRPNVVSAERKDFADAEFDPPTGFRKLPLLEVFTTR